MLDTDHPSDTDMWAASSLLGLAALVVVSLFSPTLFHAAAEMFFFAVTYSAFVAGWNLRRFRDDDLCLHISRALVISGILHLFHALTYQSAQFAGVDIGNLSAQFRIAADLVAAVAFATAPLMVGRRQSREATLWIYWIAGGLLVIGIGWGLLPTAMDAYGRPTAATDAMAAVNGVLLVSGLAGLAGRRRHMRRDVFVTMCLAIVSLVVYEGGISLTIGSETATLMILHLPLVVAALAINRVVVSSGLARPLAMAIADLERRERTADTRYRTLVEQSPMGVLVLDAGHVIQAANGHVAGILGATVEELVGAALRDGDPRLMPAIRSAMNGTSAAYEGPYVSSFSGTELWVAARVSPLAAEDEDGGCIIALVDLTPEKRAEDLARRLTFHDTLTGLANSTLLRDRLRQALFHAARGHLHVAVVVIDLDRFKYVNDTFDRELGDRLLQATAERLEETLRTGDTAARTGGDNFTLVLPGIPTMEDVVTAAEKLADAMGHRWEIGGKVFHTTASLGVALYPDDGTEADVLVENAYTAMLRAKREGGSGCQYFSPSMNIHAEDRLVLESDLRRALATGTELDVYYQPQVSLTDGRIVGVEALVRWHHPERGTLAPVAFVPLAETIGLIGKIDRLVLAKACEQAAALQQMVGTRMRVSVNMSALELKHEDIAETIALSLGHSGLPPECLEIEVTETAAMTSIASASRSMAALRAMGVTLALDDFGTGFSSLAHMRELPVGRLKIDRSFVSAMADDEGTATIIAGVIGLGRSLGMTVLAEGVETQAQADHLRELGCHEAQGYLYAKPMPGPALADYLRAGHARLDAEPLLESRS